MFQRGASYMASARFDTRTSAVSTPQGDYLPVWWYNHPMLWATDPFGFVR